MSEDKKPCVFIIESNQWEDEREQRREGKILREVLTLWDKPVEYRYIRTRKELTAVLRQFDKSGFRYLHLSCHGYDDGFAFTLDKIPFQEFVHIASPFLEQKRLFVSACACVKLKLAKPILSNTSCYSVIGPQGNILFADAALIWASFYSLIFKQNQNAMKADRIEETLSKICSMFGVRFNAYFRKNQPPYHRFRTLGPKELFVVRERIK